MTLTLRGARGVLILAIIGITGAVTPDEANAACVAENDALATCLEIDYVIVAPDDRVVKSDGGRALEQDVVPQFHDGIALREGRAELVSIFHGRGLVVGAHVHGHLRIRAGRRRRREGEEDERAHLAGSGITC